MIRIETPLADSCGLALSQEACRVGMQQCEPHKTFDLSVSLCDYWMERSGNAFRPGHPIVKNRVKVALRDVRDKRLMAR